MAAKKLDHPLPTQRSAVLIRTRNLKMARSAHAYVRGSTVKFYEWLEQSDGKLPPGPPIWICGDCHLGNLGPLSDSEGRVAVQIRDLDQTVIGNPAHDLIRLGLSLASAARGSDLPGVTTAHMLEELTVGYEEALQREHGKPKRTAPKQVQAILSSAVRRKWKHLAAERIKDVTPSIPLGKSFWTLSKQERRELTEFFEGDDLRDLMKALQWADEATSIELIDAAYWLKGCSSLGRLRYAALLSLKRGKSRDHRLTLVDIKEAVKAAAPRSRGADMPADDAERVVAGARALAPNLGERIMAAQFGGKSVVVRELMPQDLKIDIDQLTREQAMLVARYLAGVVGEAHGRQMDAPTRRTWLAELDRRRSKTLDVPPWLWSSVVELVAAHEAAYLEHCRNFALSA